MDLYSTASAAPVRNAVYVIENLVTHDVYVGLARTNVEQRWSHHRKELRAGTHRNKRLQRAYDKYGPETFEYVVIELCPDAASTEEAESFYLSYFRYLGVGLYNHKMPPNHRGGQVPDQEARRKMSAAHLGKGQTEASKAKIRATMAGRKPERACESNVKVWPALISPDGVVYRDIRNLRAFGREHGLSALHPLIRGSIQQNKGWRLYVEGQDYSQFHNPHAKTYHGFISPDGVIYRNVVNLKKFSQDHGLDPTSMGRLARGEYTQYRSWRRLEGDE